MIDVAILMGVLVPVVLVTWTAARQADTFRPALARWLDASQALRDARLDDLERAVPTLAEAKARSSWLSSPQATTWLPGYAARGLDRASSWLAQAATELLQGAAVSLVLCPLITFFLLRDGPAYVDQLGRFLPLDDDDTQCLFERTRDATAAVVRGLLLTGLLECAIATLGYALMGIPGAVVLGVLTGLASVVPVVGTSSIWVPVGLLAAISGRPIAGLLVLAWGTNMMLVIDHFVAPGLVGHRIRMTLLPVLFGVLGGAMAFGVKGLLIAPLLVSIAPTVFELMRRRVLGPHHSMP
jgi:predicted PurR-regulated permease PerM